MATEADCEKRRGDNVIIGLGICLTMIWCAITLSGPTVRAEEVIQEIRFVQEGFVSSPGARAFRVVDLKGKKHRIELRDHEKIEIVNSSHYKGPKQYATDFRGFIYEKIKMGGDYYHWFYIPESSKESGIAREIERMAQRD
jgi:hypothetical protein